ncbi:MAG: S8 family serine peptidase [Synergistaceae bacterium]|nr:S8 family serine peptidase [Synergistaceae bacterium]
MSRKKFALTFIFLIILSLLSLPVYADDLTSRASAGDVLVVLKPKISAGVNTAGLEAFRVAAFASGSDSHVKNFYPDLTGQGNGVFALIHSDIKNAEELAQELLKNPDVLAAEPNYKVYTALTPNDNFFSAEKTWGLISLDLPAVWDRTTGSSDLYVAVIDTGLDFSNPDISANISRLYSFDIIQTAGIQKAQDENGHGTHVAGIIGATGNNTIGIAGMNWNIKMIPIKALNKAGTGELSSILSAFNYLQSLMNAGLNIRVINMSFEMYMPLTPDHDSLVKSPTWRALKEIDNTNRALLVSAAGNYGSYGITIGQPVIIQGYSCYVYPASFKGLNNLISVSAIDKTGGITAFSNKSADLAAPGVGILSTWLQSDSSRIQSDGVSLKTESGTSMAAPFVSGGAALLAALMPDRTAYQIRSALLSGQIISGGTRIFDLKSAIQWQDNNAATAQASGTAWAEYNNYSSYTQDSSVEQPTENNSNYNYTYTQRSSGGGCNFSGLNIFAGLVIFFGAWRKKFS